MKETIKRLRLNVTVSAILSIVIGILLVAFPETSIAAIGRVIAVIVLLSGVIIVVSQIVDIGTNTLGIIIGVVVAVIGIWMFASPAAIMTIIPIAIGVILVVHGIQDLSMAIAGSKAQASRAWVPYLLAIINIILGFICIGNAFGFVTFAFQLIGIMLIWDGISDFGIVHKVNKAEKGVVDSIITNEEDIF